MNGWISKWIGGQMNERWVSEVNGWNNGYKSLNGEVKEWMIESLIYNIIILEHVACLATQ